MDRCPVLRLVLAAGALALAVPVPASAAEWRPTLRLRGESILTDNVYLGGPGGKRTELVAIITPTIGVSKEGARLRVNALYSPSFVGYLTGAADPQVANALNGTARLEAIENFFFIDGRAQITQGIIQPLGVRPADVGAVNPNRVEIANYGVSPYVQGRLPGGSSYLLRGDFSITTFRGGANPFPDTRGTAGLARWQGRDGTLLQPSATYDYFSTQFGSFPAYVTEAARGRLTLNAFPTELSLYAIAGYESNDFVTSSVQGPIYGGGFEWRPSPRTTVKGQVENRFFGNSYEFDALYRTALTAWSLRAGRRLVTLPQQVATAGQPSANSLRSSLDAALIGQFPDPAERAREVDRILSQQGLASSLLGPTPLLAPQFLIVESVDPSVSLIGRRSTVTFSVFARETTPASAAAPVPGVSIFNTFTAFRERGGRVLVRYRLDPLLTATGNLDRIRVNGTPTTGGGTSFQSTQTVFQVGLERQIDPRTFGNAAFRWQSFESAQFNLDERAILLNVTHTFF